MICQPGKSQHLPLEQFSILTVGELINSGAFPDRDGSLQCFYLGDAGCHAELQSSRGALVNTKVSSANMNV